MRENDRGTRLPHPNQKMPRRQTYSAERFIQQGVCSYVSLTKRLCWDDTILTYGSLEKFKELLLENTKQEFCCLINEGRLVARMSLQVGLDRADLSDRTMASAVALHRSSWLQSSDLPYEVQSPIQDLPPRVLLYSWIRWTASSMDSRTLEPL